MQQKTAQILHITRRGYKARRMMISFMAIETTATMHYKKMGCFDTRKIKTTQNTARWRLRYDMKQYNNEKAMKQTSIN